MTGSHDAGSGRARFLGILLFLPVPVVLWLFTRQPLGTFPSLGLGIVVMLSHPLYARPFARKRANGRCLWCGGGLASPGRPLPGRTDLPAAEDLPLTLIEPRGVTSWYACSPEHRGRCARTLAWAHRHARFLRSGILGALAVFLAASILAGTGLAGPITGADAVAFFQLVVAVVVLPLGWLGPRFLEAGSGEQAAIRTPFPVHIQALIGTWAVLWLFRLVGIWWLLLGLRHFLGRALSGS